MIAAVEEAGGAHRDPALDELQRRDREGELVLFVGAGVSVAAGLAAPGKLGGPLVAAAEWLPADARAINEIEALAHHERYLDAITAARDLLGDAELCYEAALKAGIPATLVEGTFIAHGTEVIEARDEAMYARRFSPFAELYG